MENIFLTKRWHIYHLRWQTSGLVIAPCVYLAVRLGLPLWAGVIFGNFCGATAYYFFDQWWLNKK